MKFFESDDSRESATNDKIEDVTCKNNIEKKIYNCERGITSEKLRFDDGYRRRPTQTEWINNGRNGPDRKNENPRNLHGRDEGNPWSGWYYPYGWSPER